MTSKAKTSFYSGLGIVEKSTKISEEMTKTLSGHSLVSGRLYALVEAAWARGEDLARHVETLNTLNALIAAEGFGLRG